MQLLRSLLADRDWSQDAVLRSRLQQALLLLRDPAASLDEATWLLVAYVSRYSSLAALLAALLAPLYAATLHGADSLFGVVVLIALALIAKHWGNLQRLMAGQEGRIGGSKAPAAAETPRKKKKR